MKRMKCLLLVFAVFTMKVAVAQKEFVTPQANFIYKLVTEKGGEYFTKNFEAEFTKRGLWLMMI